MTIDSLQAAQQYAQIAQLAADRPAAGQPEATARPDFSAIVQQALQATTTQISAGEDAAVAVAKGEAGLVDVVTAVSAAEVSLEAAIAVRNRVIEAYQEIMRMPI